MIGALARGFANLLGRGEAAVTVPPLDGALRPNRLLDEAEPRVALVDVDCLAIVNDELVASAGNAVRVLADGSGWVRRNEYNAGVACIAPTTDEGLAVALANGEIFVEGGRFGGRKYRAGPDTRCLTAMVSSGVNLYVANGSANNPADDWQRDLLQCRASGSIWRIDLDSGESTLVGNGFAWPAGLALDGASLVCSEAWKHRLVRLDPRNPQQSQTVYADLPAYPGRIAPAANGYWLALFAPRSQLVEFILREPDYRKRMMSEVQQPFWVAPTLRSGRSFYESLQGGGVKHLGLLKPWAPTLSAGLCVKLDQAFQPRSSLQSRADGRTHGVTSAAEHRGQVFVAARGDGVIVSLPLSTSATNQGAGT